VNSHAIDGELQMSTAKERKAVIDRMYDETNKGNYEVLREVLADDFTSHGGGGLPDTHGPQALIDLVQVFMGAMPDLQFQVLQLIADDDNMVVARGLQIATHAGNFMGIAPPTGKKVEWTGTATFRFNDEGKIAERWVDMDSLSLFQQLGVIPAFGAAGG
jgi:predicted ester cyclase